MNKTLCLLVLLLACMAVGCKTTGSPKSEWGETYADVVVPASYQPYDTPPFRRTDGANGRRVYGRYAYRHETLDDPASLAAWFKKELPKKGWEFQVEEINADKGTFTLRFIKGDDKLGLKLAPDTRLQSSDRFSVLVVEMNAPYDN
ncbi:MAG: hypothetical protein HS108_03370 [Planctomycetes bacterium]|jgi:hypothetical protein|nr:hypothetical protein [Planctomycetota bacterium]MCL4731501.1 hypothetical protein [Planctomycetota bacterium]